MKKRVLPVILSILLVFSLVPTAFAADADGNGYNDHDYAALRDFLDQPSADGTNTNGQQLNALYDPLDPSTWSGVTWTDPDYDEELHLRAIDFNDKSLAGSLNVSGCTELQGLSCSHNQLTSIDISECAALYYLECIANQLTTLYLSGNAELDTLECIANQLTTLDLSGCPGLETLACEENQLKTLDVSGLGSLRLLGCSFNSLASLDVSANTALYQLDCRSNALSTLDASANTNIATLLSMDNPMTQLSACIGGNSVNVASGGNGYIGLYYDMALYSDSQDYYVQAYPVASAMFYNWTENGSVVSADATFSLDNGRGYDLTANWTSQVKTAYLTRIDLSAGSLSRTFTRNTYSYKIYLAENQRSVTLTPEKEYDGAAMTINRQPVSSYTVNVDNGKSRTVTVKVTYGGLSRVYTFVVTRAKLTKNN